MDRVWIIIIILGLGWGASFSLNEVLLRELGPVSVSAARVAVGALGCWAYLLATRTPARLEPRVIAQTAVMGIVMFGFPFAIYPIGQQFIASGVAGIVNAMTPILVVIVSHFWPGGERATRTKSAGVVVGFVGALLLALPALGDGGRLFGVLFVLLAPVCYGVASNYVRRFGGLDQTVMLAWALSWAALGIGAVALTLEGVPVVTRWESWAAMAVIGLVLTAASFIVFFRLLPVAGATRMSTVTFVAPVSAVLIGWLALGEDIGPMHLAGMALIFAGLLLIDGRLKLPGLQKVN
jgi:drug/metabolite transporter (DMT)-like permease